MHSLSQPQRGGLFFRFALRATAAEQREREQPQRLKAHARRTPAIPSLRHGQPFHRAAHLSNEGDARNRSLPPALMQVAQRCELHVTPEGHLVGVG